MKPWVMAGRTRGFLIVMAVAWGGGYGEARAADGAELRATFDSIRTAELIVEPTLELERATLDQAGLTLVFEKGRLAWLQPVTINGRIRIFGAYFEGRGRMLFTSPLQVEQAQLRQFFKTDSLNRGFDRMLLLFSEDVFERLNSQGRLAEKPFKKKHRDRARDLLKALSKDDEHYFVFETLKALTGEPELPFLLVNVQPAKSPRLFYMFDPNRREEVALWRHHNVPGESYMEQICGFAADVTTDRHGINGHLKSALASAHYDIDV